MALRLAGKEGFNFDISSIMSFYNCVVRAARGIKTQIPALTGLQSMLMSRCILQEYMDLLYVWLYRQESFWHQQ